MRAPRRVGILSIACGLAWSLAPAALNAQSKAAPADAALPTVIEEALIEYACGALRPAGSVETEAYVECRKDRLIYLRAEFGRDLRRLTGAERKTIDTACSDLRASRGQDAYVSCLQARLAALPGHGKTAVQSPSPPPLVTSPAAPLSSLSSVWIGGAVSALIAAGVAAFVVRRRRQLAFGACRACGATLVERGDLCHPCRREAAENLRRATTERVDQARAEEEAQRRLAARESEHQRRMRDEEASRHDAEAAQEAQTRQNEEEAQRRREDEARQRRQHDAEAPDGGFDPHAVLGLPHGASAAEIETAYQGAKAKLDPELVSGLGADLQDHFKRKALAAQRAYEILTTPRRQ